MEIPKKYHEILSLTSPKEVYFACIDRINELKTIKSLYGLHEQQEIELSNLHRLQMDSYSKWKD